ncbi:MAG: AarF/ABC1/UbiB kinase family protein [Lentisphaeria bacterium]|nr:AarF/ABC1/UbiB kinase family protein [Lentisphaeria bacterium]
MGSFDTIRHLPRAYRRLSRFRHILRVLFKYGFDTISLRERVPQTLKRVFMPWRKDETTEIAAQYSMPERLRMAFVELGPTFVKLGQVLAQRQDMIPPEFVHEFSKLQDNVPPFGMDLVRQQIRTELGRELEEVFSDFDEHPVGAASMAQGHLAKLKDGTEVFVKIQRPGIAQSMRLDLEILVQLAAALERHSEELGFLRPVKIVEEFKNSLEQELDFSREMANQMRFAHQFKNREGIHIPWVYEEYCTKQILVMEFVRGIKATNLDELRAAGADLVKLSELGANLLLEQFFDYGFFHADPHPGNMIFQLPSTICYIDFGNVGRITVDERKLFGDMMMYLVAGDFKSCARVLVALTEHDGEPDMGELERDLGAFSDQHLHRRLNNLDINSALHDLYHLCYRQGLFLKPHIYMMFKALAMSDKLGRDMNPNFELMKQIQPFAEKLLLEQMNPMGALKRLKTYKHEIGELMDDAPRDVRQLLKQLLHGKMHFEHSVQGMTNLSKVFDGVFNRLAAAIVLAAMLVGSSIVVHANPKPHWYGTSIMGLLGYVISAVGGLLLLWDMMKHRG